MRKLAIVLIDDHPMVRRGYQRVLERAGHTIEAEFADGRSALRAWNELSADLVVLDVVMPGLGGFETARELRRLDPAVLILVSTAYNDRVHAERFLPFANGFVGKPSCIREFRDVVATLADGNRHFDPDPDSEPEHAMQPFRRLSAREFQIMIRLARGATNAEIATEFFTSPRTVANQRLRVLAKLGLRSNVDLARLAIRHGLIEP